MKKILQVIKNFLWSMLAEKGEISSKRSIATGGMATLVYITIYSQHTGKPIDHYVFGMLCSVVIGAAGITAWEKGKGGLTPALSKGEGEVE